MNSKYPEKEKQNISSDISRSEEGIFQQFDQGERNPQTRQVFPLKIELRVKAHFKWKNL